MPVPCLHVSFRVITGLLICCVLRRTYGYPSSSACPHSRTPSTAVSTRTQKQVCLEWNWPEIVDFVSRIHVFVAVALTGSGSFLYIIECACVYACVCVCKLEGPHAHNTHAHSFANKCRNLMFLCCLLTKLLSLD